MANIWIYLQLKNEQSIVLPNVIICCFEEETRKTRAEPFQSILDVFSWNLEIKAKEKKNKYIKTKFVSFGKQVVWGKS